MGRPKGPKNRKKVGQEVSMPDVSSVYRKRKGTDWGGAAWNVAVIVGIVALGYALFVYTAASSARLEEIDDCVRLKAADNMKPYSEGAWREFAPECGLAIR